MNASRRWFRLSLIVTVMAMVLGIISGCNTMKGFGKDVENAGQAIQRSTQK